ncbi:hypothetical protein QYE76_020535 [Lolium multiflorum]|uniref:Legumain prodomain domain-containing protein n=1 Tax=Lolium multiflorum TaxID=4521 RepID=A0AAD8VSA2_LOLMU|nr:hypothetical protein QYE76_020535 [Lolium multiflorum]
MARLYLPVIAVQLLLLVAGVAGGPWQEFLRPQSDKEKDVVGTRWAVLIAGSKGFENYRHQADVCHAYQIMKKGGLRDENIVVFMYDDIANNSANPRPGVIINNPNGSDVYAGVPKDYTGKDVDVKNFLAVLLGNNSALTGGSGKVVNSSQDDHIFVYYSDDGGPGVLGMPIDEDERLYANDLVTTLEKKHAAGTYKSLVFYVEAAESGSIFEGLLPANISVYATTASNAVMGSWTAYCPGEAPPEFTTCLGDLYSVAWMEDSDAHSLGNESLELQYEKVKNRAHLSPVMQYGDLALNAQNLSVFMGSSNPANHSATVGDTDNSLRQLSPAVKQRDAGLLYFWHKYRKSSEGMPEKSEARKELMEVMAHRSQVDNNVELIGGSLFGTEEGPQVLNVVRPTGQPLVDDWDCLKSMVHGFEEQCGLLRQYGMKHTRAFANMCNAGIGAEAMRKAASKACTTATPAF